MSRYDELLDFLQAEYGGIGPARIEAIREEFPEGEEFIAACRAAYDDRETEALERIHGIGRGYALHKLGLGAAEFFGWEGGDAEPVEIDAMTRDELMEKLEGKDVVVVPNPFPEDE